MEKITKQLRWLLASLLLVVGVGSAWGADENFAFSSMSYTNGQAVETITGTDCTITFNKGTNSNAPKYYTTGSAIRCYGANYFTVSSATKTIEKIELTFGSGDGSNDITTDVETYTSGIWSGSASSVTFTIGGTSGHRRIASIAVTYAAGANTVATPTISPDGGSFITSQEVTITCSTSGATIKYSTDEGATWQNYSSPFNITETTTVKAKATKSGMTESGVATATFTKAAVITSLQALQEATTSTTQDMVLQLTNVYVTAVKNANAWITDGTFGALIYTTGHGLSAGQKLNGTITAQHVLYRGQTEITDFSSTGLTITEEAFTPVEVTNLSTLSVANQSLLVTLKNVTYDGTVLSDGTNTITPYTTFMSNLGLENGKTYNITGVVIIYNTTLEIAPRTAEDIVEVGGQVDTRTETHIRFTQGDDGLDYPSGSDFTITVGDDFTSPEAWVTFPSGVYMSKSAARPYLSYSGDNDEVATVNSETGVLTFVAGATGTITVTATFVGTNDYKPCEGYYTLKVKPEEVTPTGTGDEITYDFIGVSGNSYTEWSGKEGTSGAVYAGNTAGGPSNDNHCVQMRSNNNNSGIVTTTSGGKVTLVTVEWNSSTSNSRTLDIYGSNTAYTSAADLYNSSTQGTKLGSICIDDATQLVITGDYAYIGIRSSNGAIYCDKITIYWEDPDDQRIATTTTFDGEESYTITLGDNFNSPTATLNPATAGTLTYESSNENVATVAADGVVTIIAAGTTTITATFAGNNDYKPSSASYTLTVNQASVEGDYVKVESANDLTDGQYLIVYESEEGNLAFDGSLEILDANQNTIEVEIENNTILSTPTIDASSFFIVVNDGTIKSASGYYIGQTTDANGLKASTTTEYENAISIDEDGNADITSGGAYLRFNKDNGNRFRYYKSSTYTQQQVIALYKKNGTPDTRTATTVTLDPTTTSYNVILGDAFTAPTATLDPAAAGTLTYESSDPTVATVTANGAVSILAAGTTTITAKFAGNDDYKPSKASYTLTVTESAVVYTSLKELQDNVTNTSQDFTLQMLVDVYVTGVKGTNNAYISDGTYGALIYTNNHGLEVGQKLNGTLTAKFVLYKGATEITNFNTTGLTISEGTMAPWIRTIGDITVANQSAFVTFENVTYDATAKTFSDGMNSIAYYDNFGVNPTLEDGHVYNITGIIVMYNNLQIAPLAADDVVDVTPVTVELVDTQDCYKTLETPYDVDLTNSDLEAYIVTLNDEQNDATFVSVTIIPAETPVILHAATEGTYTLTRAALGASLDDVTDNELKVSDGTVTGDAKTIYVLNKRDNEIGFYLLNNGKTLAEGKCYLQIEKANGAKFIGFHFEGEATGIASIESTKDKVQGTIYDLQGRRVTTPAHGLYIVNGKKVFIK